MSVIEAKNLQVNYNEFVALQNVTFEIKRNEFIGIIGPNGGGKTTLVKTLIGLLKPSKGTIKFNFDEAIGYVPQITTFDKTFPVSVIDVILLGHLPKKITLLQKFSKDENLHANTVMKLLGISDLKDRQIGELSGGQMQRVLIARALMNHPTVLILDEPTASVDVDSKKDIYKMLFNLNKTITIIMITHDTNDMLKKFDRIFYINKTIHIHSKDDNSSEDFNSCPIDWYVEGKKIHKELLEKEENK